MLHKPDSEPIYGVRGSMPFFKNDWNYFPKKKGRVKKLSFFHTPFFLYFALRGLNLLYTIANTVASTKEINPNVNGSFGFTV